MNAPSLATNARPRVDARTEHAVAVDYDEDRWYDDGGYRNHQELDASCHAQRGLPDAACLAAKVNVMSTVGLPSRLDGRQGGTASPQPRMRWWILQRWRCYWRGHRELTRTPSYGAVLTDGRIRELHFCFACSSVVWTERQPTSEETHPTWQGLQI